jgi:hypothetical protein
MEDRAGAGRCRAIVRAADRRLLGIVLPSRVEGDRDRRRLALRAVLAFAAAAWALGMAGGVLLPIYHGPDEKAHVAYVDSVLDGHLPTLDTPVPRDGGHFSSLPLAYGGQDRLAEFADRGDVWVANHPPLTYVVAAPFAGAGAALGFDEAGPLVLRVLSATGFALGLLATASIADALVPSRPEVAATTVGLVALSATLLGNASYGYTDGVAFGVGGVLLATILRTAGDGASTRRLIALVALSTACALTRSSLLPLVVIGAAVWVVVAPGARRLLGLLVLAAPALLAGWFYLRNQDLYGSVTGADRLFEKFDRRRSGSTLDVLLRPRVWVGLWQATWAQSGNGTHLGSGNPRLGEPAQNIGSGLVVGGVLVLAGVVGGALEVVRRGVHPRWSLRVWLPWLVVAAWVGASTLGVASFLAGGGTPHGRYLLPILPVLATVVAVGLQGLPRRVHAPAVAAVALAGVHLVQLSQLDTAIAAMNLPTALEPPAWSDLVAWLLLAAGVGALVRGVGALDGSSADGWERRRPSTTSGTGVGVVPDARPDFTTGAAPGGPSPGRAT